MTVRPTSSGQPSRADITRTGRSDPAAAPQRPADNAVQAPAGSARDAVQISPQARELQQLGESRGQTSELAPARLRAVLDNMAQGRYDQPDVQTEVVRRLAKDL